MRLARSIAPHVDSELEYHPITLALFQVSCGPFCSNQQLSGSMARLSLHAVGGNVTGVLMTSQRPLTYTYTLAPSTHSDMTQHTFGAIHPY